MRNKTVYGDCRTILRAIYKHGVRAQMCVTSPPYWGLRDYGVEGQLGLEKTPEEYVANMVEVFRLVRGLLADDGTLWLNLGDSYAAQRGGAQGVTGQRANRRHTQESLRPSTISGLKHKDLVGIPWRVAFALQADGWHLRQDIIWHKPNPMPESVRDRCTKSHEYLFLLSKSGRYYFDHEAIKEDAVCGAKGSQFHTGKTGDHQLGRAQKVRPSAPKGTFNGKTEAMADTGQNAFRAVVEKRNRRSVWTIATKPYKGAHFATFPPALVEPCILAGSRPGDVVLDPFMGSGTTAEVAERLGRQWIGCDLNPGNEALQRERLIQAVIPA